MRCRRESAPLRRYVLPVAASVTLLASAAVATYGGSQRDTISSDALRADATAVSGWVALGAQLDTEHGAELLEAIEAGLRSRVVFEARLYRSRTGITRLLGDQLIAELQITHVGFYDPLADSYILDRSRRQRGGDEAAGEPTPPSSYQDRELFSQRLLSLHAELIGRLPDTTDDLYVALRVRLQPVDFVAPLHIISMFGGGATASSWRNMPLDR